ncbi:hypothetical protein L1987_40506 [Smallanthus sonchifolius]|uniref:Uncharacterized protein n=1 Tax=Smallanthus sonchifolius TaxID=185202 RepID=A0ACB9GSY3_9ASTR|nr:hypothetical protein L1987_40506 [Smallanthus sonchifolius]
MVEAQAMILNSEKHEVGSGQTVEEDRSKPDSQKRKAIVSAEVEATTNTTLSLKLWVSDAYDVHSNGSPLITYRSSFHHLDIFLIF